MNPCNQTMHLFSHIPIHQTLGYNWQYTSTILNQLLCRHQRTLGSPPYFSCLGKARAYAAFYAITCGVAPLLHFKGKPKAHFDFQESPLEKRTQLGIETIWQPEMDAFRNRGREDSCPCHLRAALCMAPIFGQDPFLRGGGGHRPIPKRVTFPFGSL